MSVSLVFKCVVQSGEGLFSRMIFPSGSELPDAPEDWGQMARGSLNCKVIDFPGNFHDLAGEGDRIAALDQGKFEPEFTIPAELIHGNSLLPYPGNKRYGLAQVWRCAVVNEDSGEKFNAWHVRRVDGTYPPFHGIIELMADRKLRDAHDLGDGTNLTITMYPKTA